MYLELPAGAYQIGRSLWEWLLVQGNGRLIIFRARCEGGN